MEKVKVAVVGCGMISSVYLRNMKNLFSILDVVAVSNRTMEKAYKAAETFGIPRALTVDEVAADPEIELVVNLTPTDVHAEIIRKMLLAGKHVYTEKTMTAEMEDARELVKLADEKHLYLGCAPDTVLGASVQTARWAVDHGMIGDVTSCVMTVNRNQLLNAELFRFLRGNGGSLPYDVGIYYLSALLCILGPVKRVTAFAAPSPVHRREFLFNEGDPEQWLIPGNNLVSGSMQFESGALGTVHIDGNTTSSERHCLRIYGTRGILELADPKKFGDPVKIFRQENPECVLPLTHGYNGYIITENGNGHEGGGGHRGVGVAEMAWAMRMGRPNRLSKEYGLHAMEVLYGFDRSAETGRVYEVESTFSMAPLKEGYYSSMWGGYARADAEASLID